jgi:phosphodiesterase/alkaline phosphatase D-like protein
MVLATSVKNKRKDETEQETRGVSTYLLGAQEREWYSDDGQFSVSWKLIAAQVPGRIAFFLRIFQVGPATASACS